MRKRHASQYANFGSLRIYIQATYPVKKKRKYKSCNNNGDLNQESPLLLEYSGNNYPLAV